MDLVGENLHYVAQESCAFHLSIGMAQFAAVDVDATDLVALEPLAPRVGLSD